MPHRISAMLREEETIVSTYYVPRAVPFQEGRVQCGTHSCLPLNLMVVAIDLTHIQKTVTMYQALFQVFHQINPLSHPNSVMR